MAVEATSSPTPQPSSGGFQDYLNQALQSAGISPTATIGGSGSSSPSNDELAGLKGLGITPNPNLFVLSGNASQPVDYSLPVPNYTGGGEPPTIGEATVGGPASVGNQPSEQDLLLNFLKLPEGQVTTFQQQLADAGLLMKPSQGGVGVDYRVGDASDPTTLKAMQYVYAVAAARGMTVDQALAYLKAHPVNMATGSSSGTGGETTAQMSERQYKDELVSAYTRIWGTAAPPGYIDKAMSAGMNVFEFIANEKNKPSYAHSPGYQYDRIQLQHEIASWFGALG